MTEAHAHEWTPVPGQCACYACACGALGCRNRSGLVEEVKHAAVLDLDTEITARPIADRHTGRMRARILDDWEFWQTQQEL